MFEILEPVMWRFFWVFVFEYEYFEGVREMRQCLQSVHPYSWHSIKTETEKRVVSFRKKNLVVLLAEKCNIFSVLGHSLNTLYAAEKT